MSVPSKKTYKPSKKKGAISFTDDLVGGGKIVFTGVGIAPFGICIHGVLYLEVQYNNGGRGYIPAFLSTKG